MMKQTLLILLLTIVLHACTSEETQDQLAPNEQLSLQSILEQSLGHTVEQNQNPRSTTLTLEQQISNCWLIDPKIANVENMIVKMRVTMNPDRSISNIQIVDTGQNDNPDWAKHAASLQQNIFECSPLNLPIGKYEQWKVINFTFDPKQMFE